MFSGVGSLSFLPHSAVAHSRAAWKTVISPQLSVSLQYKVVKDQPCKAATSHLLSIVSRVLKSISVKPSDIRAISAWASMTSQQRCISSGSSKNLA